MISEDKEQEVFNFEQEVFNVLKEYNWKVIKLEYSSFPESLIYKTLKIIQEYDNNEQLYTKVFDDGELQFMASSKLFDDLLAYATDDNIKADKLMEKYT